MTETYASEATKKSLAQSDVGGSLQEDPFWEIALNYHDGGQTDYLFANNCLNGNADYDSNDESDVVSSGKTKIYRLPYIAVSLELAPLATDDGIWSPVGDHAWYSSALLTSLILLETCEEERSGVSYTRSENERRVFDDVIGVGRDQNGRVKNIRVLELGSGAIGLPGISFAVALSQRQELFPSWTVSLTDNVKSLLRQLEANVRSNFTSNEISISTLNDDIDSSRKKSIEVGYLDWDIPCVSENEKKNEKYECKNQDRLVSADIVIGSEVVYTRETALAMLNVLMVLLDRNPAVKIWIVQVTDRFGWNEIVMPSLDSKKNINVEKIPLTYDIHVMASTLVPMGGALDRYAFGAFRISNVS